MSKIFVIGISSSGLRERHKELLQKSCRVISSSRLAEKAADFKLPVFPITPLENSIKEIEAGLVEGNVAILASGDPLFFGIAARLIDHFGNDTVTVIPALSSMQEAFARFTIPWDDAAVVSLHGRKEHHVPGLLLAHKKTFVFTDKTNSPDRIARKILAYFELIGEDTLKSECRVHVAENLGAENERITIGSLQQIADKTYNNLNVICLLLPSLQRPAFGLSEDEIVHSRGLITKDEIRAATLHRLRLPRKGVFWDIGGGSGSISIEAAALNPQLTVYTVEHKEEGLNNIKNNICRFNCYNVIPIFGRAVSRLSDLPDPDAVFIGGSGGELQQIIKEAAARLSPAGRIVINSVTEKTAALAPQLMEAEGFSVEHSRIEVSRTGPQGSIRFNPITIMVGRR